MKLTFKKFKHSAAASEETIQYTAILCVDGVELAACRNNGCGESDLIRFYDGAGHLSERLSLRIEALPEKVLPDPARSSKPVTIKQEIDTVTAELACMHADMQEAKKKREVFVSIPGETPCGAWEAFKIPAEWKGAAGRRRWIGVIKQKYPEAKILDENLFLEI
jgi:hypothetical protein